LRAANGSCLNTSQCAPVPAIARSGEGGCLLWDCNAHLTVETATVHHNHSVATFNTFSEKVTYTT